MNKKMLLFFTTLMLTTAVSTNAITIKLGSLAPTGSPWDNALRKIASEWAKVSNNRVILKIYPGGIAGDEHDMLRKMKINQIQASALTGAGMTKIFSGVLALQLPLLIRTDDELYYVLEKIKPELEQAVEEKGFKVIIWSKVGWVHFFSKKPVVLPKDLQCQKIFTYNGDPDGLQAWKNAGFKPVPLSTNDIMSSLQSGMIDAISTTPLSAASYQWFGIANNMCGMNWAPLLGGVVISTKYWNRLPAELRKKLYDAAQRVGKSMQAGIDNADEKAIEVMKNNGLKISEVPNSAVEQWKTTAEEAYKTVVGKSFDKATYESVKRYLKEYRTANGK